MIRKYLLSVAMMAMMAMLSAPQAQAQFRYAGTAGVNVTDLTFKQDLVSVSSVMGYTAGVEGEMMFPGIGFGIDLGLRYTQMGARVNLGERVMWKDQGFGDERAYLHYLQIPFHLKFKYTNLNGLEESIAPFVFGGPDFTIKLANGKCKAFDYAGGELGLTAGVGAELFKNWQVSGSYTWGMTYSLKTVMLENFSAKNRAWTVRVAYFF